MTTSLTRSAHHELLNDLSMHPCAQPGGYPRYAITDDGGVLCSGCAKAEHDRIHDAIPGDGFYLLGVTVNWDDAMTCDHCGSVIASAYGGDNE